MSEVAVESCGQLRIPSLCRVEAARDWRIQIHLGEPCPRDLVSWNSRGHIVAIVVRRTMAGLVETCRVASGGLAEVDLVSRVRTHVGPVGRSQI